MAGIESCLKAFPTTSTPARPPTNPLTRPNHLARFRKSPPQAPPIHLSVLAYIPSHHSSHPLPLGLPSPTTTPIPQPNQPTQPTRPRQHPYMDCGSPRSPNARSPLHRRGCPGSQAELKRHRCSAKAWPLQCKGQSVAVQRIALRTAKWGQKVYIHYKNDNDEVAVAVQRVALCSAKWVKTWSVAVQRAVHCVSEGDWARSFSG